MKYTVAYYERYPLDPQARFDIYRETVVAETKQEAGDIMAYCGKEVIGVSEYEEQAREIARDNEWLEVGKLHNTADRVRVIPNRLASVRMSINPNRDLEIWQSEVEETRKSDHPR